MNGVWQQDSNILGCSGAVGNANQVSSVSFSADGLTSIVGGPEDNKQAGAMLIFRKVNGVWVQY